MVTILVNHQRNSMLRMVVGVLESLMGYVKLHRSVTLVHLGFNHAQIHLNPINHLYRSFILVGVLPRISHHHNRNQNRLLHLSTHSHITSLRLIQPIMVLLLYHQHYSLHRTSLNPPLLLAIHLFRHNLQRRLISLQLQLNVTFHSNLNDSVLVHLKKPKP